MGKTAFDVALACDALLSSRTSQSLAAAATSAKWQNMSVGFVDIEQWRLPADTQVYDENYQKQTVGTQPVTKLMVLIEFRPENTPRL